MKPTRLWIYRLITGLLPETRCFGFKSLLLRWCGAKVGDNVRISSSAILLGDGRLEIGDDVWVGAGCRISPVGDSSITIGPCCDIGPEVMIITGSHEIDINGFHIAGKGKSASVNIGDGCWLGARTTILPGVTLASKTLVAAAAVVTKSVSIGNSLVVGVPAKIVKTYTEAS